MTHKSRVSNRRSLHFAIVFGLALILLETGCQSVSETALKPKSAANEAVALGALRTIASAQASYSISHDGNYGTIDELVKAGNLDVRFSGSPPVIGGYLLTVKVTPKDGGGRPASYTVNADPQQKDGSGASAMRYLYMDSSDGAIHVNAKQPATSSDPPL